jgi:hypothetical protein
MWHRAFKASFLLTMVLFARSYGAARSWSIGRRAGRDHSRFPRKPGHQPDHLERLDGTTPHAPLPGTTPRGFSHSGRRQLQGALTRRPGRSSSGR